MRFLVDQLTDGQLEWAQLPATFDAVVLGDPQGAGKTYRLHSGKWEYFQRLKDQFPGEAAAIDEFQRLVKVEADPGGMKRGEFGSGGSHKEGNPPWHLDTGQPQGIMASPQKRWERNPKLPFSASKMQHPRCFGGDFWAEFFKEAFMKNFFLGSFLGEFFGRTFLEQFQWGSLFGEAFPKEGFRGKLFEGASTPFAHSSPGCPAVNLRGKKCFGASLGHV